ncbi:hypothetical protein L208DRAFT_1258044, partial [Tricholoma matsutake]
ALQLIDEGWEMAEVVEVLNVSSKSIRCWDHHYEIHGCAIEDLHELIHETPSLFLEQIGEWLALYHDLPISTTTLHDNLWELGLTFKLLWKAAAEWDEVSQAEWLLKITNFYTADQFVVLDESSKDGKIMLWRYGCAPSGEDPFVEVTLD